MARPSCLASFAALLLAAAAPTQQGFHYASKLPMGGALVFDSRRNVTVVLEAGNSGRLWHWDGTTFREQVGPVHTYDRHGAHFDPVRGEIHTQVNNGIATWNGASWRTTPLPTGISLASMAFDVARRRLVATNYHGTAVIEWDGDQWTTIPTPASPGRGDAMVFDPRIGACVLAVESTMANPLALWTWDGAQWSPFDLGGPTLYGVTMAFDPAGNQLLLHGGDLSSIVTWTRGAAGWTQIATPSTFSSSSVSLAWDGTGVLRLGTSLGPLSEGLWRFENGSWRQLVGDHPPKRRDATVASSPVRLETVLFSGYRDQFNTLLTDTWSFTGTWRQHSPTTSPPPRSESALAWSDTDQAFVLFGGRGASQLVLADTWTWDGSVWTRHTPPTSPPHQHDHRMATDPAGGVTLLGGRTWQQPQSNDHWRWRNGTWQNLGPAPIAAPTAYQPTHPLAYDPLRNRVITASRTSAFEWDGSVWSQIPNPPTMASHNDSTSLVFDPATQVVLYHAQGDAEVHGWDGTQWTTRTVSGVGGEPLQLVPDYATGLVRSLQHNFVSGIGRTWNGCDAVLTATPAHATWLGYGCGRGGAPGLSADGRPRPGDAGFGIAGTTALANAPCLLGLGFPGAPQHLGAGCVVWIGQTVAVDFRTANAHGHVRVPLPLPPDPALRGLSIVAQLAVVDPARGAFGDLTLSPGLSLSIGD